MVIGLCFSGSRVSFILFGCLSYFGLLCYWIYVPIKFFYSMEPLWRMIFYGMCLIICFSSNKFFIWLLHVMISDNFFLYFSVRVVCVCVCVCSFLNRPSTRPDSEREWLQFAFNYLMWNLFLPWHWASQPQYDGLASFPEPACGKEPTWKGMTCENLNAACFGWPRLCFFFFFFSLYSYSQALLLNLRFWLVSSWNCTLSPKAE
jgi:hypothetical protein